MGRGLGVIERGFARIGRSDADFSLDERRRGRRLERGVGHASRCVLLRPAASCCVLLHPAASRCVLLRPAASRCVPLRPAASRYVLLAAAEQRRGKWGVVGGIARPQHPTPRFIEKIRYSSLNLLNPHCTHFIIRILCLRVARVEGQLISGGFSKVDRDEDHPRAGTFGDQDLDLNFTAS